VGPREPLVVETSAAPSRHLSIMATAGPALARWSSDDLEDLGGAVIAEATVYAIWWGEPSRFPADAMSGMDTFLSGLDGSRYLAIVDQYVRRPARTTFVGHLMETSPSPTHSPSTEEIVSKVCQVLADARQVPSSNGSTWYSPTASPSRRTSAPGTTVGAVRTESGSAWPTCRTWPARPSATRGTSSAATA
jgi:hypothetical protein